MIFERDAHHMQNHFTRYMSLHQSYAQKSEPNVIYMEVDEKDKS